ncbi:tyrosine-type recombinase/integrase [Burkholderia sp. JPY481]
MASITPHKEGWRAQVYVKGTRDSQVFRNKRDATRWAAAREEELRKKAIRHSSKQHTLRQMLERYDEDIIPDKRGARFESLRLRSFLKHFPDLAAKNLDDVHTPDLAAWRDARLRGFVGKDGEKVPPVTNAAVTRDISWLRNAFNIARKEWHWMESNPFEGFRLPQVTPARDRRVLPSEVRLMCRALNYRSGVAPQTIYQEVALAFLVALRTAMRAGEIVSLGKRTLDTRRRIARVPHKMQHLTGRPREVPLTRHALRLLKPVAHREYCFTVKADSLSTIFRKVRERLAVAYPSIADLHFHDARAEALTRLSRKVDVMTLAKISGHTDLNILQNTYYRESAEDIAARL